MPKRLYVRLSPSHRHQRPVGVHPRTDRPKPFGPQQVQCCRLETGQCTGTVAPVAMGVLLQLGVADRVPALQAPAAPHQSQHAFWCGGQAGVAPIGALDDPTAGVSPGRACPPWCLRGVYLDDPAGADPGRSDGLRRLSDPQRPGDGATLVLPVIRVATKGILRFPRNWLRIWRCRVFWLATPPETILSMPVSRTSAPCSWRS